MTDTPRLTLCEGFAPDIAGCYLWMPVDTRLRTEHRRWHIHNIKVIEALRAANKEQANLIRQLTGRITEAEHDIHNIDIPEPVEPLTIVTADELEPLDDEDEDSDITPAAADIAYNDEGDQPASTYADDDHYFIDTPEPTTPASTADVAARIASLNV